MAITSAQIANDTIETANMANNAVTSGQIANSSVIPSKTSFITFHKFTKGPGGWRSNSSANSFTVSSTDLSDITKLSIIIANVEHSGSSGSL